MTTKLKSVKTAILATVLSFATTGFVLADECAEGIIAVDEVAQSTALSEEAQTKLMTLRETAIASQASSNEAGCVAAVEEMKMLIGLE